jgi:hypothetical protein
VIAQCNSAVAATGAIEIAVHGWDIASAWGHRLVAFLGHSPKALSAVPRRSIGGAGRWPPE